MKNHEVEEEIIIVAKVEDAMAVIEEVGVDRVIIVTEGEEGINCNHRILQCWRKWPLVQVISRVK